jgi:hypothetical protein
VGEILKKLKKTVTKCERKKEENGKLKRKAC